MTKAELDSLKEILEYDPLSGVFRWRRASKFDQYRVGRVAGSPNNTGYLVIECFGKKYLAHRLAWAFTYGELPRAIDHINRDKLDNRLSNLRAATLRQNQGNRAANRQSKTGVKGVWLTARGKYRAECAGRYLGVFGSLEAASEAYAAAANETFGQFARRG